MTTCSERTQAGVDRQRAGAQALRWTLAILWLLAGAFLIWQWDQLWRGRQHCSVQNLLEGTDFSAACWRDAWKCRPPQAGRGWQVEDGVLVLRAAGPGEEAPRIGQWVACSQSADFLRVQVELRSEALQRGKPLWAWPRIFFAPGPSPDQAHMRKAHAWLLMESQADWRWVDFFIPLRSGDRGVNLELQHWGQEGRLEIRSVMVREARRRRGQARAIALAGVAGIFWLWWPIRRSGIKGLLVCAMLGAAAFLCIHPRFNEIERPLFGGGFADAFPMTAPLADPVSEEPELGASPALPSRAGSESPGKVSGAHKQVMSAKPEHHGLKPGPAEEAEGRPTAKPHAKGRGSTPGLRGQRAEAPAVAEPLAEPPNRQVGSKRRSKDWFKRLNSHLAWGQVWLFGGLALVSVGLLGCFWPAGVCVVIVSLAELRQAWLIYPADQEDLFEWLASIAAILIAAFVALWLRKFWRNRVRRQWREA